VFSNDSRRERRGGRPRARAERVAVEGLEGRQLLAYSPLGFSLPQLSVTGYAPSSAAYGGPIVLDVTVANRGASSIVEPTNLAPGSISGADAVATTVEVFAAARPNANSNVVKIDTIQIPLIAQNSEFEILSVASLPAIRPAGFPGVGGKIYLTFVVDNTQAVQQISRANNIYRDPTPITITNALPDLQVIAFDVPGTLQPGDVISPTIQIANFGSADPASQGPVTVQLIASTNTTYGPGDSVVGSFTINSLPGVSGVPTQGQVNLADNVIPPPNVTTVTLPPLKLPTTPGFYYLGVKIDPNHTINQTYGPNPKLSDLVTVGPPNAFLPAASLVATTTGGVPIFPAKPSAFLTPIGTIPTTPVLFPVNQPPGGLLGPVARVAALSTRSAHAHPAAKLAHAAAKPKH